MKRILREATPAGNGKAANSLAARPSVSAGLAVDTTSARIQQLWEGAKSARRDIADLRRRLAEAERVIEAQRNDATQAARRIDELLALRAEIEGESGNRIRELDEQTRRAAGL